MVESKHIDRFWSRVSKCGPVSATADGHCWDWLGSISGPGYGNIYVGGPRRNKYAHRLSWEIAHGDIPSGMQIAHLCGRRICVNPAHLVACNQAENERHKYLHGVANKATGERHASAKLTDETVRAMLLDHATGMSQRDLARKYGVSRGPVRALIAGRTWRHISHTG